MKTKILYVLGGIMTVLSLSMLVSFTRAGLNREEEKRIEDRFTEMYGESIPSNGVAVPIEELTFGDVPTGTNFFLTDTGSIDLEYITSSDISFGNGFGPSVDFIWDDGKFDIRFDPDKLTESAKVFCEAIGPYINEHILEKAKELAPPNHITIGCECGGNLVCPISYQPEHWPLEITCINCETKYVVTREQVQ